MNGPEVVPTSDGERLSTSGSVKGSTKGPEAWLLEVKGHLCPTAAQTLLQRCHGTSAGQALDELHVWVKTGRR